MRVLCWVEAGPVAGLGHVSRALALAEALAERGVECRIALSPDATALGWLRSTGTSRPIVLPEGEPVFPHVLAASARAAAVVADVARPLTRAEVRALGGERPVVVVDNRGPGVAEADLVLAPFDKSRDRHWLVGAEHVPLRRAFRLAGDLRGPRATIPRVLVSMGARDAGELTIRAVEGLALARERARFTARVVATPSAPAWSRLAGLLRRLDFPPACPLEPDHMVAQLAAADVAVIAMGVTVYEAMACGVPAVVAGRTRAEVTHARVLEEHGAVASLAPNWTEEQIATAVAELIAAPVRLNAMASAGRAVVDGRGAERVASRLLALLKRRGIGRAIGATRKPLAATDRAPGGMP